MARTQFTFTFTNAQAGADVTFSAPVYADASTKVQDGPRLVLDSSNAVSVWADAAHLVATTIDGLGLTLSATATTATPSVTDADGTAGPAPSGGSSTVTRLGPFTVTHATADDTVLGPTLAKGTQIVGVQTIEREAFDGFCYIHGSATDSSSYMYTGLGATPSGAPNPGPTWGWQGSVMTMLVAAAPVFSSEATPSTTGDADIYLNVIEPPNPS